MRDGTMPRARCRRLFRAEAAGTLGRFWETKDVFGRFAYRGAIVGLLLAIGYNTSAQTAALEGGRNHLTFATVILCGVGGALAGVVLAAFVGPAKRTMARHDAWVEANRQADERRAKEKLPG
jgi:hypothetical protein